MNKILYYIFILICTVFASGCQQDEILEPDSVFTEKTVIFANLKDGLLFDGVTITKTLPLSVNYDIKKAEITNAAGYIKVNGLQLIPLAYTKDGVYKSLHPITIKSGNTYELFIEIDGKKFYATTYVPYKPVIEEAHLVGDQYLNAKIKAKSEEVYGVAWYIPGATINSYLGMAQDFQEITDPKTIVTGEEVVIRTIDIPLAYRSSTYSNLTVVKAYAFDKQYYDYFKSKSNNQQITNSYTQGGGQTIWNIMGTDVIGLFIGSSESSSVKPN
ncbi:MAG: DUF4249 family protein [Bacteroidota bacterium]|nr:DUF4249 family protein [Bacteroidota bacterium]MDP4193828.1 DUF4249 family protein [Bacteroidota bacterium]